VRYASSFFVEWRGLNAECRTQNAECRIKVSAKPTDWLGNDVVPTAQTMCGKRNDVFALRKTMLSYGQIKVSLRDGLVRGSQGLTERKRGAVSTAQDAGRAVPDREHKLIEDPAKRRLCGECTAMWVLQ